MGIEMNQTEIAAIQSHTKLKYVVRVFFLSMWF
jgi:hypothetical protein